MSKNQDRSVRRRATVRTLRPDQSGEPEPSPRGIPPQVSMESLSPAARRILGVARRMVMKGGYEAVSLKTVADAAGVQKSTVAYQFGDKAGLLTMLSESLISDVAHSFSRMMKSTRSPSGRLAAVLETHREVGSRRNYWRMFFGLLPQILSNPRLRKRQAEELDWYFKMDIQALGLWRDGESNEELLNVASLLFAMREGLALQKAIIGEEYDLEAHYRLWEAIIRPYLEGLIAKGSQRP